MALTEEDQPNERAFDGGRTSTTCCSPGASVGRGLTILSLTMWCCRRFLSNLRRQSVAHLCLVLLCLQSLSSLYVSGEEAHFQLTAVPNSQVCPSVDIRNTVDSFDQLKNCRVINGFLQIVLMDRTRESDFENVTFPELREITGYLLLYRVSGLTSLGKIFPNLAVIRGQDLFMNYAIAVYEMLHLQELALYSLTDIARGYVFITKNPLLCYVETIDWSRIVHPNATADSNFIAENRAPNACPKCPSTFEGKLCGGNQTKKFNCWDSDHCQRTCTGCERDRCTDDGECCSPHCLGGCGASGSDQCIACRKFMWNNHCVDNCPQDFYEFTNGRCLSARECYAVPRLSDDAVPLVRPYPYKPFDGKCLLECPAGFVETFTEISNGEKMYTCTKCAGPCRKVCEGANVDSIQSAQRLKGCVVINGSLEIQVRGGGGIVRELEDNLNMIEEITGYLKVVRSVSLMTLNFLRKLHLIRGESLENGKYAISVLDNTNLIELWNFSKMETKLQIGKGRIFFHFNPKLCLREIKKLVGMLGLRNVTDLEVAPNSNGDRVACNLQHLHAWVASLRHDMVIIQWRPYYHYEMRTLLGYVIYYIEAPLLNVTVTDGRDGCGNDEWGVIDVEVSELESLYAQFSNVSALIPRLKPYTRYAFYVKTYTIATETFGAQSPVLYFRTYPATPSPPRTVVARAVSSSEILVQWTPPEHANGAIERYLIIGEVIPDEDTRIERDYCADPIDLDKREYLLKVESKKKYMAPSPNKPRDDCVCTKYMDVLRATTIRQDDETVQALIDFENQLHENVYVKRRERFSLEPRVIRIRERRDVSNRTIGEPMAGGLSNVTSPSEPFSFMFAGLSQNSSDDLTKLYDSLNYTVSENPRSFKYVVSNDTFSLKLENLDHFTYYSIMVIVCRENVTGENDKSPKRCSSGRIDNVQTLPLARADEIDPLSISVAPANESSSAIVAWAEPAKTNGKVLTYSIQYHRVDVDNQAPQTVCISSREFENRKHSYVLTKLPPGNYSVMIRANTLAREAGPWSPVMYHLVQEQEQSVFTSVLLGAGIAIIALFLLVVIFLVGLRYFYPDSWYHRKLLFATVNPEYFKPAEGYDKWEISRRKITLDRLLGIGHFGEVYEGRAKGILQKNVTTKVAIKTLNKSPTNQRMWLNFLHEASVMKQFDTHHVVRLLGVVTKGEPLVIMELMVLGDLRTYLRSCRQDMPEEERTGPLRDPPTLREILQMAAEIADGMLYLSDKKFVHRDLAARNCMINAEGTVKIGDFGLTRDVYETDYYRKDSRGHLPVRWMAPESLRDGIFTSRSDVWSYGVVLWEMSTLASLPYTGLGNGEVMPFVISGGLMEVPESCPQLLQKIMKLCWQYKYSDRPQFSDVLEMLLPDVREDFTELSYYHTEDSKQLRASMAEAIADEDTPYTPLRTNMEDFENFSLDSEDEEEDDEEQRRHGGAGELQTQPMLCPNGDASTSSSMRNLPTVNGYIQRPHLIPLVNTKTTPC